jgi:hypothetical protein
MIEGTKFKTTVITLFALLSAVLCSAACPTGSVVVKGRVENLPANAVIRVELLYSQRQVEDSAETTLENPSFTVKVPFYTQSREPVVNGLFEKCNRKPKTVIVRLLQGDEQHDSKTLDILKDFESPFPNAYTLRLPLVLKSGDLATGTH